MKAILFILIFAFVAFGQQINSTWGVKATSGDAWDGDGLAYIDTTTGTTNDIIVDIDDFYKAYDDSLLGTFYTFFNNEGTASPTTDSLKYTIKAYPGVYADDSKSVANIEWGTAVTLETIAEAGDYLAANNVYIHASLSNSFPPEVVKFEIAPVGSANCDDSTHVSWAYRYPAIYKVHEERK